MFPYLSNFDSWFDGGMSIAIKIVDIFKKSNNFQLREYEDQQMFYEEYLSKYQDFLFVYRKK